MATDNENREQFIALVRKHESTIRRIVGSFYPLGSYQYNELVCDLSTSLWLVWRDLPSDFAFDNERAWVFVILHRHALDIVRNENGRQRRLLYGVDLSGIADNTEPDYYPNRLYRLIDQLDDPDRELILMYADNVPVKQIALSKDMSYRKALRRIERIRTHLRKLDSESGEDEESGWT